MFRLRNCDLQVFLAHPGGPLFRNKDDGHWTIPKGEPPENEALLDAAVREFEEETGIKPHGPYLELGSIRQKGGKTVHAWAFEGNYDESQPVQSNTFEMQWPPGSGKICSFPESAQVNNTIAPGPCSNRLRASFRDSTAIFGRTIFRSSSSDGNVASATGTWIIF